MTRWGLILRSVELVLWCGFFLVVALVGGGILLAFIHGIISVARG